MKTLDKKNFKLPFVDSVTYRELMRLGLRYDRTLKTYSAEDLDDQSTEAMLDLLSRILHEKVCFDQAAASTAKTQVSQTCVVCGRSFQCDECRYFELCETRSVRSKCICGRCLEEGKAVSQVAQQREIG